MKKIVYIGYSERMLGFLMESNLFELSKVVYAPNRVNEQFHSMINNSGLSTFEVNSKQDISELISFIAEDEIAVMYKFEYILPKDLVNSRRFINFHGGFLKTNRGAHATVRSILNMDKETALSMYELTGGIDVGKLIAEHIVELDMNETPKILNDKLQDGIPYLLEKLNLYLEGKIQPRLVESGKYYPKVQPEDFTIDPTNDSFDKAYAIIRSQEGYGGALVMVDNEAKPVLRWRIIDNYKTDINNETIHLFFFEDGTRILEIEAD